MKQNCLPNVKSIPRFSNFMQQVSWALSPVTLIDTKHHEAGALESALSEPISLTPSHLPGSRSLSQATDNAGKRALLV